MKWQSGYSHCTTHAETGGADLRVLVPQELHGRLQIYDRVLPVEVCLQQGESEPEWKQDGAEKHTIRWFASFASFVTLPR
jgi:hypothetical protein